MATNPLVPSFRYPFESEIAALPVEHQQVIRSAFNAITDLYQANAQVSADVKTLKTSATTAAAAATETVNNTTSQTIVETNTTIGMVNNQIGATAYSTQQSDQGSFVLLGDSAAIAVTLTTGGQIVIPWYCIGVNFGTSTTTFTPAAGSTITYGTTLAASSMPLLAGYFAIISFDGANFYAAALPIVPATITPVAGEYLTGYNAATGAFSMSTPAGISVTITTAQLTPTGTQGSMTFVGGLLTAQVAAT